MKRYLTLFFVLLLLSALRICCGEASDITKQCRLGGYLPASSALITDGNLSTYWTAKSDKSYLTVALPEGVSGGGMKVDFHLDCGSFTLIQYDKDGTELKRETERDYFKSISLFFPFEDDTVSARLITAKDTRVSELRVFSPGELPADIQVWDKPVEKADLMIIVAHQDDELLWFGGAIPYYDVAMGKNVSVVYAASCGRARRGEALDGLWSMGVTRYPDFLNLKNAYPQSMDEAYEVWGGKDNILRILVTEIRRRRPEVILTHDLKGEYGHKQHRVLARLMEQAVKDAANPNKYKKSAETYGTWEVKKLYLHLSDTETIYIDWDEPCEELGGKSPYELASIGYSKHRSQQKAYSIEDSRKYNSEKFGLVYTIVGPDELKNDFLENTCAALVKPQETSPTPEPTPEPTVAPTVMPTVEPTTEPTAEPTAVPAETIVPASSPSGLMHLLITVCLLVAATALIFSLTRIGKSKKKKRKNTKGKKKKSGKQTKKNRKQVKKKSVKKQ